MPRPHSRRYRTPDARRLGSGVIEAERVLYQAFAAGSPSPETIESLTMRVADAHAALRARHLRAHVETLRILTASQVVRYARMH
jgi:hypothetical protein